MNKKLNSKRKKAEVGSPQQPLQDYRNRAATLTPAHGKGSREDADEQVQRKVNSAVQELLANYYSDYIGYFENGVLVSYHPTLEEYLEKTYRRRIYQLGRSKRFLYLLNGEWILVTWEAVREEQTRRFGKKFGASFARASTDTWAEVCQDFGQIIWNENLRELHGKAVIA